jgi:hypothetical protein
MTVAIRVEMEQAAQAVVVPEILTELESQEQQIVAVAAELAVIPVQTLAQVVTAVQVLLF